MHDTSARPHVEAEPGRSFRSRTFGSPIGIGLETRFEDVTGGTRVAQRHEVEIPEGLFGEFSEGEVAGKYADAVRSNLEKLKELVEAQ